MGVRESNVEVESRFMPEGDTGSKIEFMTRLCLYLLFIGPPISNAEKIPLLSLYVNFFVFLQLYPHVEALVTIGTCKIKERHIDYLFRAWLKLDCSEMCKCFTFTFFVSFFFDPILLFLVAASFSSSSLFIATSTERSLPVLFKRS